MSGIITSVEDVIYKKNTFLGCGASDYEFHEKCLCTTKAEKTRLIKTFSNKYKQQLIQFDKQKHAVSVREVQDIIKTHTTAK